MQFVQEETQFHLGGLPTEQPHPATRGLAETTARNTAAGIAMLLGVDKDVVNAARRVFGSAEYALLEESLLAALAAGNRICFSGCGATGRLSILLEAAYRAFWRQAFAENAGWRSMPACRRASDSVSSIMTGGDYALIRSVESFEDYMSFGRQQVLETGLGPGDILVAISEGGETSSVIGTALQALESGARVFFACNNPLPLLAKLVERSRRVIEDDRIVKLDLSSGPMAVAGSTRMQATTAELLVIGAALESALRRLLAAVRPGTAAATEENASDPATAFAGLLQQLAAPAAVKAMARWAEMEEALYRAGGAITYFGADFLLDMFTDTTERAPTFSLPPFRRRDDAVSPRPLCFVKNPAWPTADTWRRMLERDLRCLDWDAGMYGRLGAAERIRRNPPPIRRADALQFLIGQEDDPSRYAHPSDCAALVLNGGECAEKAGVSARMAAFSAAAGKFTAQATLAIGRRPPAVDLPGLVIHVPCRPPPSLLRLWEHLAIKLAFNTISTATAARLGRLRGNWMAFVETTNKKLIDRGTRLVAELCGLDYTAACMALHATMAELAARPESERKKHSPVALTIERIGVKHG